MQPVTERNLEWEKKKWILILCRCHFRVGCLELGVFFSLCHPDARVPPCKHSPFTFIFWIFFELCLCLSLKCSHVMSCHVVLRFLSACFLVFILTTRLWADVALHGSVLDVLWAWYFSFFSICILIYGFRILDDLEMYEQQKPFRLTDYVNMSTFLNHFLYKGVLGNLFGKLLDS